jgi:hypothetical protein
MIRKQTWILVGIFAVLLGLAYYLRQNPVVNSANITQTPTNPVIMLAGWHSADITWIEYRNSQEEDGIIELTRSESGAWLLGPEDPQTVEAGKAEQIRSQIANIRVMSYMDPGYDLEALGLKTPEIILSIRDAQGRKVEMHFGSLTPTGTGYYVQVDDQAPQIVSKNGADAIFDLLKKELLVPVPPA